MSVRAVTITGGQGVSPITPGTYTFANLPSAVPGVAKATTFVTNSNRLLKPATEINGLLQKYICTYSGTRVRTFDELLAVGG